MTRTIATWCLAASLALVASAARADDDLEVSTREHGAWRDTVEALQRDLQARGARLHVKVKRGHADVGCDAYELVFDGASTQAFEAGECDPLTRETALTLVDRAALFDRTGVVATPMRADVAARAHRAPTPAPPIAGDVACSATVRPVAIDMLTGARVALRSPRARLETVPDVTVTPDLGAFVLRSRVQHAGKVDYTVVDSLTGRTLAHGAVALDCVAVPPSGVPAPEPAGRLPRTGLVPPIEFGIGRDTPPIEEPYSENWRLLFSAQCLTPVKHWTWGEAAAWVHGQSCNGGLDVTVPFHPQTSAESHGAVWLSADFGAATGTDGTGQRFWAADLGFLTLGVARESSWYSLRTGLSFRYFSHNSVNLGGINLGSGEGAGYAAAALDLVLFGGPIVETALFAPLGERWLLGVVGQGRLIPGVPAVLEFGGGVTFGRRM